MESNQSNTSNPNNNLEAKYQKLATEYSKLRAQANVLKKAVLEEQNKNSNLRESLRQKETSLRRAEQEVDSLGFRNKQLEHRVASLQDDIEKEIRKSTSKSQKVNNKFKNHTIPPSVSETNNSDTTLLAEELQKKILENAQLTSLIDDKNREIELHSDRIKELEKQMEKRITESTELERRLRKEIDSLQARNSELETKLVEAASMLGSEDALSASGSDNTPLHTNSSSSEEKIAFLEKEVFHWRTQYEILKINDAMPFERSKENLLNGPSSSSNNSDNKQQQQPLKESSKEKLNKEQILYNHFSKKFDELLEAKCMAESRLISYLTECENLQSCLENSMQDIKEKEEQIKDALRNIQSLEEDLATTRINYEEQISVLTEQVISLSEQLASSK